MPTSLSLSVLLSSCDLYRPFGASSPTTTSISCRVVGDFLRGRTNGEPMWTHYVDLASDADIRDGTTRTAGSGTLTYADGDELRITIGGSTVRFVVVWVEAVDAGSPREFKRAYLLRHSA